MDNFKVITADCLDAMSKMEENSFDACITDPPYGMGMEEWDHSVPTKEIWEQTLRILKPGGFCLSFCSPQLYHRMASAVEDAGFNIKDQIMWMVTTKMPKKNHLKQAHEPIVVAQKPFKGTIKKNFEKWGTGAIDITSTRVPWDGEPPTGWVKGGHKRRKFGKGKGEVNHYDILGVKNKCKKEEIDQFLQEIEEALKIQILTLPTRYAPYPLTRARALEVEDLIAEDKRQLQESYDILSDKEKRKNYDAGKTKGTQEEFGKEDANPTGRYPSNIIGEVFPEHQKYFYAPRVTRKERGEYNDHPTPKPISLMSYLIKVYSPENSRIIDPFCGSGSTGCSAVIEGREFVGIELSEHYSEISRKRIKEYTKLK